MHCDTVLQRLLPHWPECYDDQPTWFFISPKASTQLCGVSICVGVVIIGDKWYNASPQMTLNPDHRRWNVKQQIQVWFIANTLPVHCTICQIPNHVSGEQALGGVIEQVWNKSSTVYRLVRCNSLLACRMQISIGALSFSAASKYFAKAKVNSIQQKFVHRQTACAFPVAQLWSGCFADCIFLRSKYSQKWALHTTSVPQCCKYMTFPRTT